MRRIGLLGFLAAGLALTAAPTAFGQGFGGGTGGTGGTGGGTSTGGFTGGFQSQGQGGFTGGFQSTGQGAGFAGGTGTGGAAGGATGGAGRAGAVQYGATSFLGKYYGNPMVMGVANGSTGAASTTANSYARTFPVALGFGSPVFNNANRTTTTLSPNANVASRFQGANSAGIRRAPGYIAQPAFDVRPRLSVDEVRPQLQSMLSQSERLSSAGNIRVSNDGEAVVLRGSVANERQRQLAEAMIRLTPGVREVRNELRAPPP